VRRVVGVKWRTEEKAKRKEINGNGKKVPMSDAILTCLSHGRRKLPEEPFS